MHSIIFTCQEYNSFTFINQVESKSICGISSYSKLIVTIILSHVVKLVLHFSLSKGVLLTKWVVLTAESVLNFYNAINPQHAAPNATTFSTLPVSMILQIIHNGSVTIVLPSPAKQVPTTSLTSFCKN